MVYTVSLKTSLFQFPVKLKAFKIGISYKYILQGLLELTGLKKKWNQEKSGVLI